MTTGFTHESAGDNPVEWYTPASLFDLMGLRFDLDPASPGPEVVPWLPVERHYTEADDGLVQPWTGRVWLNPPYGRETGRWLARAAQHGREGGECIALVFARGDPAWFHDSVQAASGVFFLRKRLRFVRPLPSGGLEEGGSPGNGSMLVVWGESLVQHLCVRGFGGTHGSLMRPA